MTLGAWRACEIRVGFVAIGIAKTWWAIEVDIISASIGIALVENMKS